MEQAVKKKCDRTAVFAILRKEGEQPRLANMSLDRVVKMLTEPGEEPLLICVGAPSPEFFNKLRDKARERGLAFVEKLDRD